METARAQDMPGRRGTRGQVLIAHLSGLQLAQGVDHLTYGYGFTALLLACLVGAAALLGSRPSIAAPTHVPDDAGGARSTILATTAAAVLATALPALAARPAADACRVAPVAAVPEIAPPWTPVASPGAWRPAAANPDAEVWQRYRSGDRAIDLYVGFYCAQREGAEAVSRAHRPSDAQPWVVLAQGQDALGGAGQLPVQRLEVRSGEETRLVYLWYWVDGDFAADPLVAKLRQAKAALLGGPEAAAIIVLSSPYDAERSSARASVEQALVALEPLSGFLMRLRGGAEASARP